MVTVYAAPIYVTSAMYQHVSVVVQLLRPAQFVFLSCKSINKILNTKVYKL